MHRVRDNLCCSPRLAELEGYQRRQQADRRTCQQPVWQRSPGDALQSHFGCGIAISGDVRLRLYYLKNQNDRSADVPHVANKCRQATKQLRWPHHLNVAQCVPSAIDRKRPLSGDRQAGRNDA